MARDAGAKRVYFASASPPVRFPNVYGIDMPSASELVAANRTDEEVGKYIGADWLIYQDLEDLIGSVRYDNSDIDEFDASCFSGQYVTGDVTPEYLKQLEMMRSDGAKSDREALRRKLEDDLDADDDDDDLATDSHAGVA
jgi:amidophosphoribosyltransferase